MADPSPSKSDEYIDNEFRDSHAPSLGAILKPVLVPLASLRLTVVLFALAIMLVLIGTLAQAHDDIWRVIDDYFRTSIAIVPVKVLFPPSFFPGLEVPDTIDVPLVGEVSFAFPFPGGWSIGALMAVNLLAAHGLRFKIQAKGARCWGGLLLITLGMAVTYLVVASGSNKAGIQGEPLFDWKTLWYFVVAGLGALWLGSGYMLVKARSAIEGWGIGVLSLLLGVLFLFFVFQSDAGFLGDSEMRILWQLIKASFAGLILLAGCLLLFKKRGGIVLLHWGVALLMFNELFVGLATEEAQMTIEENQTVNYVRDIRELEIAIVDSSGDVEDDVIVIPQSMIADGETITHEWLPFNIEVVSFMQNSDARKVKPGDENPATAGQGKEWIVDDVRAGTGADTDSEVDLSAAYLRFVGRDDEDKPKDLGTYLTAVFLTENNLTDRVITPDGKAYDISLRFKRNYKDYAVTLLDVRKDDYLGTNTPRNYSSDIQLVDEERQVDREVKIWMNNPLRFAGETFYQSGYHRDSRTGAEFTTLAVVSNAGWMVPYVCCMIVVIGMLAQFGITLNRFVSRRAAVRQTSRTNVVYEFLAKLGLLSATRLQTLESAETGRKSKQQEVPTDASENFDVPGPSLASTVVPVMVVAIFAAYLLSKAMPPRIPENEINLYEFGKLPLVYEGRVKPFDTLARNNLQALSNYQTFVPGPEDPPGFFGRMKARFSRDRDIPQKQPAIRWLLDMIAKGESQLMFRIDNREVVLALGLMPRSGGRYSFSEIQPDKDRFKAQVAKAELVEAADRSDEQRAILHLAEEIKSYSLVNPGDHRIFRIENREVLETLGLKPREGYRYSLNELLKNADKYEEQVAKASNVEKENLSVYQRKILELSQKIQRYRLLELSFFFSDFPPVPTEEDFENNPQEARQAAAVIQPMLRRARSAVDLLDRFHPPLSVPQLDAESETEEKPWMTFTKGWTNNYVATAINRQGIAAAAELGAVFKAYQNGDADAFNESVKTYRERLEEEKPDGLDMAKVDFEAFFNHASPFYYTAVLYLVAFVLTACSWLGWTVPLNRSAFWLIVFAFLVHTAAGIARIYISGRPPVTNLYSSAVFIGWGAVLIGIVLELIYGRGVGNVIAAVDGFSALGIAHILSGDGDTFVVLQAVLDTQFWLATHVVCITLGYATTFVAGILGVLYVIEGVATPSLKPQMGKDLCRMIYGTVCFAMFFSFFGTVLGGLWADDSWGRFWGWDPKENGALIIVLWNALILHARWGALVKDRGLAVLAVGGNIVTAWSWFGVNELGVGLHSYGFTEGVLMNLAWFVLSQVAIIIVGLLPLRFWGSARHLVAPAKKS